MGVYYSVSIAFGFASPPAPDGEYDWEWQEENVPPGFNFTSGGDMMNGTGQGTVYALPHHIKEIFHTGNFGASDDGFGISKMDNLLSVSNADRDRVRAAARELGVSEQLVGYYVISSVG